MADRTTLRSVEGTAVVLFLLQALRVLFSSLFGLIYDVVFAETMAVADLAAVVIGVLIAFLAPLLVPLRKQRAGLFVTAVTAAGGRVALTINNPTVRLWSALLVIAAASAYGAALWHRHPKVFGTALPLALVGGQLLRAAGDTYDMSLRTWWLPVQGVVSLATAAAAWFLNSQSRDDETSAAARGVGPASGLALGAFLFLEISLLAFPNAVARLAGADYVLAAPLLVAATVLPLVGAVAWGAAGLAALALLIGWLAGHELPEIGILLLMLLGQIFVVLAIRSLVVSSHARRPRLSFVLGMSFFFVLNLALAFAFTYPYTLSVFRDTGVYVFLVAAAVVFGTTAPWRVSPARLARRRFGGLRWGGAAGVVLLTIILVVPPAGIEPEKPSGSFRVGTYNIHYGYDTHWRFSLEEQARTIERSGADIVMLQEVDAGRVTSYGVDDALWLSRRLGMHHVFGPALEGLSGVALLSRFPITESDTEQLTSELEQTAIVHARVSLDGATSTGTDGPVTGRVLDAYGTWLGLETEERARQLTDALSIIGDTSPAVLGGDFNATPGSPTHDTLQAAGFQDPFVSLGIDSAPSSPAIAPSERIDFVWVRGLEVRDAVVLDSLASDHRMVVVELALR